MDQVLQFIKDNLPSMENIIKLIDVIIWPSIVLVVIIMLKKPIKALLPFIENIKYKDFEVTYFPRISKRVFRNYFIRFGRILSV